MSFSLKFWSGKAAFLRLCFALLCLLALPFASWVVAQTIPLKPPTGVRATAGNGSATVSWQGATGATSYRVLSSTAPKGPFGSPTLTTTQLASTLSGLTNGKLMYFVVCSVRGSEISAQSSVVTALPAPPPPPPTFLSVTPQIGALTLRWSAVQGVTRYAVYRSETIHQFNSTIPLANVSRAATTYTDRKVVTGKRYYYVVRAVATGQSMNSPETSGIALAVPTPTPKPTIKPTPKPTATTAPKPTAKPTATATAKPLPTATSIPAPTPTATPVPTATATPVPTATATPEPTATETPVPTATVTPVPTATDTPLPTFTPVATETPVPTATATAAPEPTATATPGPTATATAIPTATPVPMPGTGVYRITTRGQQGMALDVAGFDTTDGSIVQMWDAASTCNQQWLIEKMGDGSYRIHAYSGSNSTEMLDLTNGATTNGTTVKLYHDNGNSAQSWIFRPVGGGFYRIIPQNAGADSLQTLDMSSGNAATRGSTTAIYTYFGGNNQVFRFDPPGTLQPTPGVYSISPKIAPALAFDVDSFKNANGTDVLLWNNTGGANQQWLLETGGGNIYKVSAYRGRNSLQVLDNAGGGLLNGNSVTTYEDTGSTNQQWYFKLTDGYYRIIPQPSGWDGTATLDVRGGTSAGVGSRLNIYSYYGTANQLFSLNVPTTLATLASAKKGIGGRPDAVDALGCSWFYNWGGQRPSQVPLTSEFVPMMWGYYGGDQTNYINFMKSQPGAQTLLAFNEPDHTDQANLSVDRALEGYAYLANAGVPIGSPVCADDMSSWLQDFMNGANARGYRVDYICVHAYQRDPWAFLNYIDAVHNRFNKPIWITEFGPTSWGNPDDVTDAEAMNYMKVVLPELNKRWYVQRYAWYSGSDHSTNTLGPAALVEYEGGPLTPLGKLYARY